MYPYKKHGFQVRVSESSGTIGCACIKYRINSMYLIYEHAIVYFLTFKYDFGNINFY